MAITKQLASIGTTAYFRDGWVPFEQANLSIASAAVLYGLSIYTVFAVSWNEQEQKGYIFRLADHFKRLQNSAKIMAFDDFNRDWNYKKFSAVVTQLLQKNQIRQDSLVRVGVFVDDSLKGTRMLGLKHSLSAFVYSTPPLLPKDGAHLCVSSWRRTPDNAIPSRAKINGSYVNAALMKHEAVLNGFDDAIALDEQGHVTESTVANLFLVRDGRLVTPSKSTDLLEGITRGTILGLADSLGIQHEERTVDRSEIYLADEIFLCGSSVQITPVTAVDHRPVGTAKPGKLTKRIQSTYYDIVHHHVDDIYGWLTLAQ
jgi:branched-chain amino acid aminotransferase